jgi:hypothetical protein
MVDGLKSPWQTITNEELLFVRHQKKYCCEITVGELCIIEQFLLSIYPPLVL